MGKVEAKEISSEKIYLTTEERNQVDILRKQQDILIKNKDMLVELETLIFKYKKESKSLKKEIPELKKNIETNDNVLSSTLRLKYGDFNLGENYEVIKVGE